MMGVLYNAGIKTELFPLLIFIGVGAMIDFSPLLSQPKMALLGAAGQFGIFGTLILAILLGFPLNQAASIGVIGAIDGPTSIFVATKLAPEILAPIAVAAYSYMSLIPIIQPPLMKLLTTKKERLIRMDYAPKPVSQKGAALFPGHSYPGRWSARPRSDAAHFDAHARKPAQSLRRGRPFEQGRTERDHQHRHLVPGPGDRRDHGCSQFLNLATIKILGLGLIAFVLDTVAGLLFGKLMTWSERLQDQPADRRGRHFRLPDGRDDLRRKWRTMRIPITSSSCMPWAPTPPASWAASLQVESCYRS
jgi:carboxybiotin decarboxylase